MKDIAIIDGSGESLKIANKTDIPLKVSVEFDGPDIVITVEHA